jgi:fibronectin type 3 domain-containing protein
MDTSVTAGTTYYYYVKATNSAGDSPPSSEVSATPAPPAPTGLTPTAGVGQVALSWNSSSGATGYKVFRGTSPGGESSTPINTPTGTTYTDTTVAAGTTYYYYVKATNSAGDSPPSSEVSATPAPPAPTGLSAMAGAGQVALSWNSSSGATGYKVFRGTTSGGESSTPIATPSGTSYIDTNVTAGTKYYYTVKATNTAGDSPASSEVSATPTSASTYQSTVLSTPGLVSYWRLDETSGTTAHDQTSGNPGTYTGSYTLNQPGALANDSDPSAAFAGGYVDVPNSPSIQNLGSVTLEAWVYWTGSGEQFIMTKGGVQWDLEVYGGRLTAQIGPTFIQDTQPFPQNSWQYVAMTYDGTTLSIYRNGTLVASSAVAAPPSTTADLFIGHYPVIPSGNWTGRIDEPAVYNTALPATTIQNHYNTGTGI